MRRFLLMLVCVTVLVCLLAAPAFAASGFQTYRPPVGSSVFWASWWYEYSPSTGSYWDEVSSHQAYDRHDKQWFEAVPLGRPILISWLGYDVNYGTVSRAPDMLAFTVDVTGPDGYRRYYGSAEAKAHWAGAFVWDWWWNTLAADWGVADPANLPEPFNPSIGAGVYGNTLMLPLDPLPEAGKYTVTVSFSKTAPSMSLLGWEAKPAHLPAGSQYGTFTYDMYVK